MRVLAKAFAGFLMLAAVATAADAKTLRINVTGDPAMLDPITYSELVAGRVLRNVYEGFTDFTPDGKIVNVLAESWTALPGEHGFRFNLRKNVKFHSGRAFTAKDVKYTLEQLAAPDTKAGIGAGYVARIVGIEDVKSGKTKELSGVKIVDDHTIEIRFTKPDVLFPIYPIWFMDSGIVADKGADWVRSVSAGTGPFKFKEWQPNGFIALEKNAGYWDKAKPRVDGVKFNIVPESATRQVGLTSGQYQILPNIDAATALQLRGRPNVRLVDTLELAYTLIGMNVSKPPFDNPKVREALNYALNRQEIVQAALFGAGVPGGSLSPALKDWAVDVASFPCFRHDPAKAQALLREAGITAPIAITLLVLPRQDIRDIAQVVQQQLNRAGFRVELRIPEIGQFVQDWRNSNFDAFASTNAGSTDPDDYYYRTFRTGGSTNVFKYSNPELDALLDSGRRETAMPARKAAYDRAQAILACQGPAATLTYGQLYTATRNNVQGFDIIANRSLMSLSNVVLGR